MKCDDVKRKIDLGLRRDSLGLDQLQKSHIESCDDCREYYNRAARLAGILNVQKFEVYPGELDDITFEKIAARRQPEKKSGYLKNIFPIRWAWVPVAAAMILLMFFLFPRRVNYDGKEGTVDIIDWSPPFSTYVPEGLDSTALTDIMGDSDLELLEDVIINNSEVNNLIESLSDEEFDILYERLNSKSGSA